MGIQRQGIYLVITHIKVFQMMIRENSNQMNGFFTKRKYQFLLKAHLIPIQLSHQIIRFIIIVSHINQRMRMSSLEEDLLVGIGSIIILERKVRMVLLLHFLSISKMEKR